MQQLVGRQKGHQIGGIDGWRIAD